MAYTLLPHTAAANEWQAQGSTALSHRMPAREPQNQRQNTVSAERKIADK